MKLRYFQEDAVSAVWQYYANGGQGNALVGMPTGTGKSVVIGEINRRALEAYPGTRILNLTHVKELIGQNCARLFEMWPTAPAGIYSAGLKQRDISLPIIFGGVASVAKRVEDFGHRDLVLVDEAHLMSGKASSMYGDIISRLKAINPKVKVVGFTATLYRLGMGLLTEGGVFDDTVFDLTSMDAFNRLIAEGYLAPLRPKRTDTIYDVSQVHLSNGEFVASELEAAVDDAEKTFRVLQETVEWGSDRRHWLLFAAGISHAEHIADGLKRMGVACEAIHSKISDEDRAKYIAAFKAGRLRALVNNNVLTTGFDFPPIDLIGMYRPTLSPGLWVQMLGRGTRPVAGKKDCLVLDFAGNTARLGPINDPLIPKKKGGGGGTAPVKTCEECGTINHSSVRFCVHCGNEFPKNIALTYTASNSELIRGPIVDNIEQPIIETFRVDQVVYRKHEKPNKKPSMRVTYFCGLRQFSKWVHFDSGTYADKKGRSWWRERAPVDWGNEVPPDVETAVKYAPHLHVPGSIKVWVNRDYPEITEDAP